MKKNACTVILLGALTVLSACGANPATSGNPASGSSQANIKISTQGSLASGTKIGGINVTLNLPPGVTVKASPDSAKPTVLVVNAGVVIPSGVDSTANVLTTAIYTPASGGEPGSVALTVVNANGFGIGEFVTITCDLAADIQPAASDFNVTGPGIAIRDLNGASISGINAALSMILQ